MIKALVGPKNDVSHIYRPFGEKILEKLSNEILTKKSIEISIENRPKSQIVQIKLSKWSNMVRKMLISIKNDIYLSLNQ